MTKKLSTQHRSLVSPWDKEELLFHLEAPEATLEANHSADFGLLLEGIALVAGAERFFYGYPVFLDERGFLSPLFFTAVEVAHVEDRRFVIRPAGEVQLNHHVFNRHQTQPEELRAIQSHLEGQFESFAVRLRATFEALGLPMPSFVPDRLEPFPTADLPRNRWVNRPILYKSERKMHTHHLRRELEALAEYPRLFTALGTTAAGVLAGVSAPASACATTRAPETPQLLTVLPLNSGQKNAARAGLCNPLAVVTGPPGTGKSQVVVDLLASCALARCSVLFSSKNNRAVDVVRDRLRATLGQDRDWTLRLGSRQTMAESQQEMSARLDVLRLEAAPALPPSRHLLELSEVIRETERRIQDLKRAQLDHIGLEHDRQVAERLVDPAWVRSWTEANWLLPDQSRVKRLLVTAEGLAGMRPAGLWLTVTQAFAPSAMRRMARAELASLVSTLPLHVRTDLQALADRQASNPFTPLAEACERFASLVDWRVAEERCLRASEILRADESADILAERLDTLQRRHAELSANQLGAVWTSRVARKAVCIRNTLGRYFELSSRVRQTHGSAFFQVLDQFKSDVRTLTTDLPLWIVTNLSVRNAVPLEPALFELLILDEASQCDIPSALPLLFRARRVIVIGDPRQLRHISTLSASEEERLATEYDVARLLPAWSYNDRSVYALSESRMIERDGEPLFLADHYRSHPEIIEFSNRAFYQRRLTVRTALEELRERLENEPLGLYWHDVRGSVPRSASSAVNEPEIRAVLALLHDWSNSGFLWRGNVDFGIVTPFRLQMERLEEAVRTRPWWNQVKGRLTVGTAHRFQGDERDVMIFSPVVAEGMLPRLVRWVADGDQLLNVALTRARAALHVVGDLSACLASGGFLGDFAATVNNRCSATGNDYRSA
ncbi:MAG TPA: AAA domain-containing protein [Vicinamibacterales bacterium]|nr:AAA domain-containing protein [Vicinamibacterales bacterium]